MIFEGLAVFAVLGFIISRVLRQDKWLGAIIQLGAVQDRERAHNEIQEQKKERQGATSWRLPGITSSERVAFTLGILNIAISGFILGRWPLEYAFFYTPKAFLLIGMRWLEFRKRGTHYLLLDFCYFANFLLLAYIWVLPHRSDVFQIVFVCANGPLAWAVLAFNQSLVLHKWNQITRCAAFFSFAGGVVLLPFLQCVYPHIARPALALSALDALRGLRRVRRLSRLRRRLALGPRLERHDALLSLVKHSLFVGGR